MRTTVICAVRKRAGGGAAPGVGVRAATSADGSLRTVFWLLPLGYGDAPDYEAVLGVGQQRRDGPGAGGLARKWCWWYRGARPT